MMHTPRWFRERFIAAGIVGALLLVGSACYRAAVWIWP